MTLRLQEGQGITRRRWKLSIAAGALVVAGIVGVNAGEHRCPTTVQIATYGPQSEGQLIALRCENGVWTVTEGLGADIYRGEP
jgi:hypothetical protein